MRAAAWARPMGIRPSQLNWEQFYAVTERNYYGTVYTCNAVVPGMKKRGYGKVVNVISVGGLVANSDGSYAHYASAKASHCPVHQAAGPGGRGVIT
ncbi:MAG: SDR family NAD(P)-dependent oxidoreductase [Enterocloster bolteae]